MSKDNHGKRFEEDIRNSVPEEWFCYRLKDSSGSWSNDSKSRFTPKNMCDFFIFSQRALYGIECKSFKGKSMPFGNLNDKKGKKLDQMIQMSKKQHCEAGFILNFRDINETYYIQAAQMKNALLYSGRKSLSLEYTREHGFKIPQKLKKVRYKYDLENIL